MSLRLTNQARTKSYMKSVDTIKLKSTTNQGANIEVHFSPIGASIFRLFFPPNPSILTSDNQQNKNNRFSSDIVLHCQNPTDQNDAYFGAVVGRVANRIAKGKFMLNNGIEYTLPQNNGEHCLHGGTPGFSHRMFEVKEVTDSSVTFTLISYDGDQGFPADILVSIKYTLISGELSCEMSAELLTLKSNQLETPINLAQHSYFNLGGHDCADGVLSHALYLPSEEYTPTDDTSIPLREVVSLDREKVMDFRLDKKDNLVNKRVLSNALVDFGERFGGLTKAEATDAVKCRNGKTKLSGEPFGFDHNYVINRKSTPTKSGLFLAGVIEHGASGRRMIVKTNAPGAQLYTSNYLDGSIIGKEGLKYLQWQGICLETQHFPDSIGIPTCESKFFDGSCFILKPGGPRYNHTVSYTFEYFL